jgi:uncharacterized protein (TIGR00251 family)
MNGSAASRTQKNFPKDTMLLKIKVAPRASRNLVKEENGWLKVYLTKPAIDGLANAQLVKLLAEYFKVKKYQIEIVSGAQSRNKVVKINE